MQLAGDDFRRRQAVHCQRESGHHGAEHNFVAFYRGRLPTGWLHLGHPQPGVASRPGQSMLRLHSLSTPFGGCAISGFFLEI